MVIIPNIHFSFRKGGGSAPEIIYGTVEIRPTTPFQASTSLVLPAPTTIDLINGEGTATNVYPTPAPVNGQVEWAYRVKVTDRHGKTFEWMVGVPDSTGTVEFASLPRYYETKPPLFGQGPKGDPGEAATISIGTTTSGTTPSVTNSGTNQAAVLNFVLPKGDKGDTGPGVPAGGTALQYVRKNSGNTATEWATLNKAAVGLSNVDNTSDANKPVSTAQGAAISGAVTASEAGEDGRVAGLISSTDATATQQAGDARYLRPILSATPPEVDMNSIWINSKTGKMHYPVDHGASPMINNATNPSFEAMAEGSTTAPVPFKFTAVSQNLRYSSLDTGVEGQNWSDRVSAVASIFNSSGADIIGYQESYGGGSVNSQVRQVIPLLSNPEDWGVAEGYSPNGILYKLSKFDLLQSAISMNINKTYIADQRSMTYAIFRHKESGRRFIFASAHLSVSGEAGGREESAALIGKHLQDLRYSFTDRPPVFLTGDFNDANTSAGSPFAILASYGLQQSTSRATTVTNPTFNSYNGFDPTLSGRQNGSRIDAVLVTSDVEIPVAGVYVKFASGSSLPLATPLPSDHNMIRAEVSLTGMPPVKQQGATSPATVGGGAVVYLTSTWSSQGEVSAIIDPRASTSSATAMYPAGQTGAMGKLLLVPGKTYTVAADLRVPAVQTGALDGGARTIRIGVTDSGGVTSFSFAVSNQPPNAAGTYRPSVTFTLPVGSQNCFIRLMNGSREVPVYWDGLTITEGVADPGYFDGDFAGCYWEGTPHASRSVYPGPSWVEVN